MGAVPFSNDFRRLHFGTQRKQVEPTPEVQDGAERMVSTQLYRDGMARVAAAVHIVTTDGPAGSAGFTASAACSVTDNPPTLLVCLNRASQLHSIFQKNGVFCLNTLTADQQALSELFARHSGIPMPERFAMPVWETGKTGAPALRGGTRKIENRKTNAETHSRLTRNLSRSSLRRTSDRHVIASIRRPAPWRSHHDGLEPHRPSPSTLRLRGSG